MQLDLIPRIDDLPAADSAPSQVRSLIPSPRAPQCSVLRGLLVAVAMATLMPFEWVLSRRDVAAGPTSEYTRSDCRDAYPNGYPEEGNNWWSEGPAACFGGWRRGSYPCDGSQRHFEGWRGYSDEGYTSNRVDDRCGGSGIPTRNAWRWTAGGGLYRCSDAWTTTVWNSGERHSALTIAMCRL